MRSTLPDFWAENGCSVLYVEQRGQNGSGGSHIGMGLTERFDCADWVDWATLRCGRQIPIYLAGLSMGATTVLMAAGLQLPPNVHGIMADCGFTSPHAIWKHVAEKNLHVPYGLRGVIAEALYRRKINMGAADYSTVAALKNTRIPVLLIHGAADKFVPVEMTAASDGTVESITQDDLYGTTVTIDHGNGLKSTYSNLADKPTVKQGDSVGAGDVIGSVGATALCEVGQGSHVHIAMSKDGNSVDPTKYLPS